MNITLDMVDQLIERTGCTYKEAKEALTETEGDILEAVVLLEDQGTKKGPDTKAIGEKLKEAVRKGNVNRIIVKKGEKTHLDIPLNVGVLGVVFLPFWAVTAVVASIALGYTVLLEKEDGSTVDFREVSKDTFEKAKEKGEELKDVVTETVQEFKEDKKIDE